MELVWVQMKSLGLHIFLLRLIFLFSVKLFLLKRSVPGIVSVGLSFMISWRKWFHYLDADLQEISRCQRVPHSDLLLCHAASSSSCSSFCSSCPKNGSFCAHLRAGPLSPWSFTRVWMFFKWLRCVLDPFPLNCRPRSYSFGLSLFCFPFHRGFQLCLEC